MIYVIKCEPRRNAQIVSPESHPNPLFSGVKTDHVDGAQLSVDDFSHMMQYDVPHKEKRVADLNQKYGWGEVLTSKHHGRSLQ